MARTLTVPARGAKIAQMIFRVSLVFLSVLAIGCGAKKDKVPAGASGSPPVAAIDATAAAADPAAKPPAKPPAPAAISKETRTEYQKRLRAGRKLAKAAQWAAAIIELEAALVAIPGDDRALSELAWASFSAGDHAKATKAGHASVLAATDPKVKAASLYNLGRVAEATGKTAEAASLYQQSIDLRPNPTVANRLSGLGEAIASTDPLPCQIPMPEAELCRCLEATASFEDPSARRDACELTAAGAADFKIATYPISETGEANVMLVTRQPQGWAVVAQLTYVYNPGMMGIHEDWSQGDTREQTLGGKQVVQFVTKKSRSDSDMGLDEVEVEDTETLVACVRGDGKNPTTCPLDVITSYSYVRDRLGLADDAEMTEVTDLRTKGLPIRNQLKVSVTFGADGVAKIRAVSGRPADSQLGDRKLW